MGERIGARSAPGAESFELHGSAGPRSRGILEDANGCLVALGTPAPHERIGIIAELVLRARYGHRRIPRDRIVKQESAIHRQESVLDLQGALAFGAAFDGR